MHDTKMPYDATAAKRYVLRELMEVMDRDERKKLKGSFKPDSEPWETEEKTRITEMHSDIAGPMNSGKVDKHQEGGQGVTNTPPSTGSSSDNSDDNEPVTDSINEYSRKRYKRA